MSSAESVQSGGSSLAFNDATKTSTTLVTQPDLHNSENEVDKDELIDEMQQKFGELLDANQQLGNAKKQIENLKQRIIVQEKTFKKEKETLENEINQLNEEITQDKSLIEELRDEIRQLRGKINEKDQEQIRLKEQMSTNDQMSRAEIRDSLDNQKREFQALLDKKNKEIEDLHKQVIELRAENLTNNDSMIKKHIELEKLTVSKGKLENQFRRLEAEKTEADERAASLRQLIHKMKEEKTELTNKLSGDEQLIEQMKNEIIALKRTIESQKDDIEELNDKVTSVNEILPECTDFNQLIDELNDRVELAESLPVELKKVKKQLMKSIKALGLTKSQAEEAGYQISQLQENSSLLQQQNDQLQEELSKMSSKYKFVLSMQGNVKTIVEANKELVNRINRINASLNGIPAAPSLRNIIVTAVILKRWRSMPGSPKKFEKDTRNWWWICGNEDHQRMKEEPIRMINDLMATKQKLLKKIDGLTNIIHDAEKTHEAHEKIISEKTAILDTQQTRTAYLQERVDQLEEKLRSMVDPKVHSKVCAKYDNIKKKLIESNSALTKSSEEMMLMQHEITMLKQKEQSMSSFKKNCDLSTQQLKEKLQESEEEILMLRQALSTKNREITTLERVTNRIKPAYLLTTNDERPTRGNRQSTEISISSSISSTNANKPLQERLIAMSRNIN